MSRTRRKAQPTATGQLKTDEERVLVNIPKKGYLKGRATHETKWAETDTPTSKRIAKKLRHKAERREAKIDPKKLAEDDPICDAIL